MICDVDIIKVGLHGQLGIAALLPAVCEKGKVFPSLEGHDLLILTQFP